ncbi:MAG: ATP-dependent helicase [Patescibacteria group bacterium]
MINKSFKIDKFKEEYKRLNPEQKEAVDTIEGPVMVVAGPGTGKTQILTLRIANILKQTDASPEDILALTFTEAGVLSMRARLTEIIGSAAYRVTIATFHGFAESIIKTYPEEFPRIVGSRHLAETERLAVVEEIIKKLDLNKLKTVNDPLFYIKDIIRAISNLKREGISPSDYEKVIIKAQSRFDNLPDLYHKKGAYQGQLKGKYKIQKKKIEKNQELLLVYKEYQTELTTRKLYDFEDMIMELQSALMSNQDLLLILQEQYQYILADEHQDANKAQNRILELLASYFAPQPNLFVVGDDKQAIFRFQGASLENFYYFQKLYPEAKLISLVKNYRSTQKILDSAEGLISSNQPLQAVTKTGSQSLIVYGWSEPAVERYFLIEEIKNLLKQKVPPTEIAVLYRENSEAGPVAEDLFKAGIPVQIESDRNYLDELIIKKILIIFKVVKDFGDDRSLLDFLHLDMFELDPWSIFKIRQEALKTKKSLAELLDTENKLPLDKKEAIYLQQAWQLLKNWTKRRYNIGLLSLAEEIIKESGLINNILTGEAVEENLNNLDDLFNEIKTLLTIKPNADLEDFFVHLDIIQNNKLNTGRKNQPARLGKVRLMTAHRAKGQEFRYVYLIGAVNGRWGNSRRADKLPLLPEVFELLEHEESLATDKLADERRLFYVALTRAKEQVTVTYSLNNEEGKEQLPCAFIEEIKDELKQLGSTKAIEEAWRKHRGQQWLVKKEKPKRLLKDPLLVGELFRNRKLSVTALNNYLNCPWRYFYRSLLRWPEAPTPHLLYGSTVHKALEYLFKSYERGLDPTKKEFLNYFSEQLEKSLLTTEEKKRYDQKGRDSLFGWFDTYHNNWHRQTMTEVSIKGVELEPGIILTGKIDKLELLGDNKVVVVDYKTGSPKTRNQILGLTKNSTGDLWRQLVFYKLLFENYKEGEWIMEAAELDFVEPGQNDKYRKERFEIETEEVEKMKELIKNVVQEILTLDFWDKSCQDKKCEYCQLRKMLN